MVRVVRQNMLTILVAMVTAAVTAGGPVLAAAVQRGLNADQVDSRHAVGAGASKSARAGKLVATNSIGVLPNNIITNAPNAQKLDGIDSTGFLRKRGTAADADKLDGIDSTGFLRNSGKAADADQLDGRDSSAFASADESRFITLDPYGAWVFNATVNPAAGANGGIVLPDTGNAEFAFAVTLPPDYRAGTNMTLRLVWSTFSTSCTVNIVPNFVSVGRAGEAHNTGPEPGLIRLDDMNAPATSFLIQSTRYTLSSPNTGKELRAGDHYGFGLFRSTASDTCGGNVVVHGASITY